MTQLDPMDQLRDQFRAAAARDIAKHQRRRWPSRRWLAIGGIALVGSAGVATAVELIAVGENAPGNPESAGRYGIKTGQGRVAVQADDPGRKLPWAVVTYEKGGVPCAVAGALRGNELGVVEDGTFRPFGTRAGASCASLKAPNSPFFATQLLDGRLIYYGRAQPGSATVEAHFEGEQRTMKVGPTGAFLFVFDHQIPPNGVTFVIRRGDGSVLFRS